MLRKKYILYNRLNNLYNIALKTKLYGRDPYTAREITDKFKYYLNKNNKYYLLKIYNKIIDYKLKLNIPDHISRKVFIPKSGGLFLQGIARLDYLGFKLGKYTDVANSIIELIIKSRSRNTHGYAWGAPFIWYSHLIFPPNTPTMAATYFVAHGLLDIYILYRLEDILDKYLKIYDFITKDLNIIETDQGIYISYSPYDKMPIHNSNLMAAEHLLIGHILTGEEEYKELALSALDFTLNDIKNNGSLCYFNLSYYHKYNICVQDFHAGFELSSLINIYYLLIISKKNEYIRLIYNAINKRAYYIINHIIDNKNILLYRIKNNKKINNIQDSRSYSAIILSLIQYYDLIQNKNISNIIRKLVLRFDNLLWSKKKGYYMFRYYLFKYFHLRDRVFYPRMSIAWPFRMLSEYMMFIDNKVRDFYALKYRMLKKLA